MLLHQVDEIAFLCHADIGFPVGHKHDCTRPVGIKASECQFQACEEIGTTIDA